MELSEKFCDKCTQQREENNKLHLINSRKQDENVKLLFDLSLAKAEYDKEQQLRLQIEKQLTDTNAVLEQVRRSRAKRELLRAKKKKRTHRCSSQAVRHESQVHHVIIPRCCCSFHLALSLSIDLLSFSCPLWCRKSRRPKQATAT